MKVNTRTFLAAVALAVAPCAAQVNVDPVNKYAWGENCGWWNWAGGGAADPAKNVVIWTDHLSGAIWCENIGWVLVGSSATPNHHYANVDDTDYGVNIDTSDPLRPLSGFAWSENAGWINFAGGALAQDPPTGAARLDSIARRLRGYVWGENLGWINLDDAVAYVGFGGVAGCCPVDYDCSGTVDVRDIFAFLTGWFRHDPRSDWIMDGVFAISDLFAYLSVWFKGCP